jgi:precorrin-4/cobalt-precorrin-4 C11-methyltransferase
MTNSEPTIPEPKRHPILFVGAGPGDPELITVKGSKALAKADLVIYAGSLVPEALLTWCREDVAARNSAGMVLEEIVGIMVAGFRQGLRVVRLHTGDPSLYGAVFEQMQALQTESVPFSIIPGVTAAFAAAAAMGIEYTLPNVTQTLILTRMAGRTPVPEKERLKELAAHHASMAIYLSMGLIEDVAQCLRDTYGRGAGCAIAYRVSQPGEKIVFTTVDRLAATAAREKISRQALIIVGSVLDARRDRMQAKSKLYDRHFTHGYRQRDDV